MSLNLHYTIKEGFLGLRRTRMSTIITVSTVAITLSLLSLFLLLTMNVGQLVGIFQEKMRMDVFIDNSLDAAAISRLEARLRECEGVAEVRYISPDMALEQFKKEIGEDPVEILGDNPLPPSFQVHLLKSHHTPERAVRVVTCMEQCDGVDDIIYHGRLFQILNQYKKGLLAGTGILFVVVLVAVLFLVSNTLRLTIYAQKDKIRIMELVGATPVFIRRPYLVQGMLQGFMGGGISMVLIWIPIQLILIRFPKLLIVPLWFFVFPLILGMMLGYIGSVLGVRKFLKT
ncbi:hypothetical protein JW948_11830 [bacterium]|nr:hypothetical protein [bacterium]